MRWATLGLAVTAWLMVCVELQPLTVTATRDPKRALPPVRVDVEAVVKPDPRNRWLTMWIACNGTVTDSSGASIEGDDEQGFIYHRRFTVSESGWCEAGASVVRADRSMIRAVSGRFLVGGADAD